MNGLCRCGCGQTTSISKRTWLRKGYVKGEPLPYVFGHSSRVRRTANLYMTVNTPDGRRQLEHIAVAERAMGKPLPAGAQVHHVDENKRNNAQWNLVICQDQKYHALLHVRARVRKLGGNPNTDYVCSACHRVKPVTDFNKSSGRSATGLQTKCRDCNSAYHRQRVLRKANWRDVAILGGDLGL